MEESPPPISPSGTVETLKSRSRSRSMTSTSATPLVTNLSLAHYSPEAHPTTDPSLLALTQQQVAEIPSVETALLEPSLPASFAIDPALGGGASESVPASTNTLLTEPATGSELPVYQNSPLREDEVERLGGDDASMSSHNRFSKRAASGAEDSDAELRRLAEENKNVPLDELARRVRNDENSPAAEKTRQVYGLGWLLNNCERVPDSSVAVPRNRVYARYVGICANERIKPLNPASFGKLVRLMFPEIKTRRLGVRGHSKYHYCGIRLAGEHSSPKVSHGSSGSEPPAHAAGDDHLQVFIPLLLSAKVSDCRISMSNSIDAHLGTFSATTVPNLQFQSSLSSFMLNELCFLRNNDPNHLRSPHDAFKIPDIDPFVPVGTDPDIAATLTAIYRSHCTSLVECVRYMRLKQFHQLFVSFHGTLTVPVQKLLSEQSLAPWIRESDWVMYKEMIRLLSPLALQVVPSFVLSALRQLSANLTSHISTTFSIQPKHVIESKLAPATIFASLLDRLLRVNDSAHAAARFLGNPPDREQMIKDWESFVNAQIIVDREIPCHAPRVRDILQTEVVKLLQPNSDSEGTTPPIPGIDENSSTESVLDRWTNFLTILPTRFHVRSPRHFNICLGAVASAALRDLTTNGAISFGSWWVVRCWIDEWMGWQAERGGFLCHEFRQQPTCRYEGDRRSSDSDSPENRDELGNDSGISVRAGENPTNLLEDLADNRVNRMPPSISLVK